ncbi:class I adenylate-forming enzyme family protein [Amycolatopsis sp. CA-230715]|uniref:class I adenylate-forming enzyme family protein n=1 Tax=Amycolatopsis sp. CA-230715 TaxID=2745196 RepID=UPI001C02F7CC|nr:AMP-binding protein [Amycolatopsis sp. CA-230715]QWF78603.1 Long-chain-fatty-acid--CoA ligase [Amycolatopsis sp. CA-230715]
MARTLVTLLDDAARREGGKVFLRTGNSATTYGELAARSRRVAAALHARGLRAGDRVAVAAPNGAEWLEFFFGAVRLGLIVVTLNVRYRETELDHMLTHSGTRLLLTSGDRAFYAGFRHRIPDVEDIVFLDRYAEFASSAAEDVPDAEIDADTPAVILYTSGTTGVPKGAVLTHGGLVAAASAQVERVGMTAGDVLLAVLPLTHVGGLTCNVLAAMVAGSAVVMPTAFSPSGAVAAIAEHRLTILGGVPTMWALMLAEPACARLDASSLRVAIVGGANAEPALCEAIATRFPGARLTNLYGMSEVSGAAIMSAPTDPPEVVARTLGTALPGVEARVVSNGAPVESDVDGELQLRGPGAAAGYWDMPAETAETFLPGGWVATGDIVTADASGHLAFRGRSKEMYLQGGYNVYPVEVENVLTGFPGIAMAAGIGVPDPVLGEIGRYYVVPGDPAAELDPEEILDYCRERLASYKVPRQLLIVGELPMTPAGKIAKAVLRERVSQEH